MSQANDERGELPILLGEKVYPMRPSYAAVKAIESKLGSILALGTKLAHPVHRLTVDELAIIVTESVRAAGEQSGDAMLKAFSVDKVAELIYEQGIMNVVAQVEPLVLNMMRGGTTAKKKAEDGQAQTESTIES